MLITNIKALAQVRPLPVKRVYGKDLDHLPTLSDAYLLLEKGKIKSFGLMKDLTFSHEKIIDATDRFVLPAFVDSHSHLVFAATREEEFVMKIKGETYADIAAKGGGILNSARKLRAMSEEALLQAALIRVDHVLSSGTGSIEIKSGYGLSTAAEIKMLRVIKKLKEITPLKIKATFLGAHAFPEGKTREEYINEVLHEMIPQVAEEGLAEYIDVFCEKGFYSVDEAFQVIEMGKKYGLKPKIHANQLHNSGGVQLGCKTQAISVDHLETIGPEEIKALQNSDVIPTLLPGAAFFLRMSYPPARELIEANLPVTLASDYNPGSSPCGNMQQIMSLACVGMKMTPNEAINASTINGAAAMELETGAITAGYPADLLITKKIPSLEYLPYSFGTNDVEKVILDGTEVQLTSHN